jgi:predicted metalloprotease
METNEHSHPRVTSRMTLRHRVTVMAVVTVVTLSALAGIAGNAGAQVSSSYNASIDATIADIQSFWATTMPDVYGQSYDAIPADRITSYSADNPPPNCDDGGQTTSSYEDVKDNAFYCANGDFVAYDEQGLLTPLREKFGDFAVGLVLAHEWGHAIQARVNFQPSQSVYLESQADCFAGAWAHHVAASDNSDIHLSTSDLDSALAGLLTLSDPSGIDSSQDGAHGNGFDRVSAFQDGYEGGASACADYQNNPPALTEAGYTSYSDQANGGNLSLDEMIPAVTDSLTSYWPGAVSKATKAPTVRATTSSSSSCSGGTDGGVLADSVTYCPSNNTISYDPTALQRAHDEIGDFASGVLLASEWSSAVQHQLGRTVDGKAAATTSECLTGAWVAAMDGQSASGSSLSPGDLDEAVTVLVSSNHSSRDRGTAFERVSAFRAGFKHGASSCLEA